MLPYLVAILVSYLLGCSNLALYLSKLRGVDMRQNGSGNLGASNALILMGWKAGVAVCLHDMGKAALSVFLMKWLFPEVAYIGFVAGVSCVLGHMFPFYLKFKGGKGFASYLGMVLAMNWRFALVVLVGVALLTIITDYIVVGTVAAVVSYPVFTAFVTHSHIAVVILCVATGVILYKHRRNYIRILNGTEIGLRAAGRHKDAV